LIGRCRARALWGQQLDQALSDCNLASRGHPDNAEVFDSRGLVYLRLGQYEKAVADYNAALRIQPRLPWSLYGRGLARLHLGQRAEGGADLAAATALVPDVSEVAKSYGVAP
jgi:tetratricopeptide (TPR) repeat protein